MTMKDKQPVKPQGSSAQAEKPAGGQAALNKISNARANVDFAFTADNNTLVLVGWLFDPDSEVSHFVAANGDSVRQLNPGTNGAFLSRSFRKDVSEAMAAGQPVARHRHGFVLAVNEFTDSAIGVQLNSGKVAMLPYTLENKQASVQASLKAAVVHSGEALLSVCGAALGARHPITRGLSDQVMGNVQDFRQTMSCDFGYLVGGQVLVLNMWIAEHPNNIDRVMLKQNDQAVELTQNGFPYMRPDLFEPFPKLAGKPMGRLFVVLAPEIAAGKGKLSITLGNTDQISTQVSVEQIGWGEFFGYIQKHTNQFGPLFTGLFRVAEHPEAGEVLQARINQLHEMAFERYVSSLPTMVDDDNRVIAAIDRSYPLGDDGLLVFGWRISPRFEPDDILVCDEAGNRHSVKGRMVPLIREDLLEGFRERAPAMRPRSGFLFYAPVPTAEGDSRVLKFTLPMGDEVSLKIPTLRPKTAGVPLIKEILNAIPQVGRMNHELYNLFDSGLGSALEAINKARPRFSDQPDVRQFGTPPENPRTTIIVPLYGRCDFMRHQLAQFADDPYIRQQDLIYVVDDPQIMEQVHALAAKYQWLFDVSFRVVWYGRNLGFAGANNVGARFARGERLLLLNSDAFPKQPGWLETLNNAMDTLPDAGAVGPLLQYADDSIQHAGMYPLRGDFLPGFVLNTHPLQGTRWEGGSEATEHPLLTAACLLVHTEDYQSLGGFDEGYVIGDFEDSDLCLAIRKLGKRLYVVPAARMWHLERQSQTIGQVASTRQLITLFNGWRYHKKIQAKVIADPEVNLGQFEYGAAVQSGSAATNHIQDEPAQELLK